MWRQHVGQHDEGRRPMRGPQRVEFQVGADRLGGVRGAAAPAPPLSAARRRPRWCAARRAGPRTRARRPSGRRYRSARSVDRSLEDEGATGPRRRRWGPGRARRRGRPADVDQRLRLQDAERLPQGRRETRTGPSASSPTAGPCPRRAPRARSAGAVVRAYELCARLGTRTRCGDSARTGTGRDAGGSAGAGRACADATMSLLASIGRPEVKQMNHTTDAVETGAATLARYSLMS